MQPPWFAGLLLTLSPLPPEGATAQELVLEARLGAPVRPAEERQLLRATLRNEGQRPLELLLPEHLPLVPFPAWELRDESGRVVRPEAASFQSMWKLGLQGEVLRLAPGTAKDFDLELALPPGRWTARCMLAQERAEVPWGKPEFRVEMRARPSLWTGRVESRSFAFEVGAYRTPRLELALPERAPFDAACFAEATLLWPRAAGATPERFALELRVGNKARGSGRARLVQRDGLWSSAAEDAWGAFPPLVGERATMRIDLAALLYAHEREPGGERGRYELAELLDEGWFYVELRAESARGTALCTASAACALDAPGDASASGLVLSARASPRGPRWLEVVLRNTGALPRRVPADLAYPRPLAFALRFAETPEAVHWSVTHDASEGSSSSLDCAPPPTACLPREWSWSARAFEGRDPSRGDTEVLLAPGSELTRTIDLRTLLDDPRGLLDRELLVRPLWQNRRRGVRAASTPPLVVGRLSGETIGLPRVSR